MASRNRGQKKPSLYDINRRLPTDEERDKISNSIRDAPPIVAAILGTAIVEWELETQLRRKFRRNDDDTWDELTGDKAPLGTLSGKITAAYAFGIIDEMTRDNLGRVRHIRNAFAHSKTFFDFEHDLIKKELQKVDLPSRRHVTYGMFASAKSASPGQSAFIDLCFGCATNITIYENRRLSRKIHYLKKKHAELAMRNEIGSHFLRATPNIGDRALSLGWLTRPQTDGPTVLTRSPFDASPLARDATPSDNTDK